MFKDKRGDLTSFELATLIIAITGFIIVVFFLVAFFDQDEVEDRELCRLSVLTRATAPSSTQASVPLRCTTDKLCLTPSGKDEACKQFAGEKNVGAIKLTGDESEQVELIEEAMANAMFDCWKMMGKGKLDIFGSALEDLGGEVVDSRCVVCSRVALGDDVKESIKNKIDLDEYLKSQNVPNSDDTYVEAFTDRKFQAYPEVNPNTFSESSTTLNTLDGNQIAFVFMQIKSKDISEVLLNLGGAALGTGAAASFLIPGSGKIIKALLFTKVGAAIVVGTAAVVGTVAANNAYQGQLAAAGYCGDFTSNSEDSKQGCSLIQGVPYSVTNINALCKKGIEGNP